MPCPECPVSCKELIEVGHNTTLVIQDSPTLHTVCLYSLTVLQHNMGASPTHAIPVDTYPCTAHQVLQYDAGNPLAKRLKYDGQA